jgi:hypothetical protein
MMSIDRFNARRSAALGFGLSAINPKNLILTASAAGAIAQTGISAGDQAVALAVFVVVGSVGVAVPTGIYFALGLRGAHNRGRDHGLHLLTWCQQGALTAA